MESSLNFEKQINFLKNQILNYQSTISQQQIKLNLLENEILILKSPINYSLSNLPPNISNSFSNQEDTINFLLTLKLYENSFSILQPKETSTQNKFETFKKEINQILTGKDKTIDELIKQNQMLTLENKKLEKKLLEFEEKNNSQKTCINCHENYYPKFNSGKLCIYHPGKLKYYSCKSCGADEYYTCCDKCTQCSKGCKKTNHVSQNEI